MQWALDHRAAAEGEAEGLEEAVAGVVLEVEVVAAEGVVGAVREAPAEIPEMIFSQQA